MKTWDNHRKLAQQWACIVLMLCWLMGMVAQTDATPLDEITTNAKMIGWDYGDMLDTYLSPERYKGWQVNYLSRTTHEREDRRIGTLSMHQGSLAHADNRAGNANEMQTMYHFAYAWHYNWHSMNQRLNAKTGGILNTHLGMLYNARSSNNPMQAKVGLNVAPSAVASYHFSIKNRPLTVRYEADTPLLGIIFSPNYGQSYYEIFSKGNYDHNIIVTHPINALSLQQMLTLDFSLCKTTFKIGYLGDYQQARVNHLRYHTYSHVLVLGLVKKFTLDRLRP